LKIVFGRARPIHFSRFNEYGFSWFEMDSSFQSFPSGHAVTVVAILTVFYFIMPRFLPLYILVGTVVATARAAAMYHYPSDILFGGYLGIMITAWIRMVFLRSGVGLSLATLGYPAPKEKVPWPRRLGIPDSLSRSATTRANGKHQASPPGRDS
jgi:membrane-associated phospholipid phosphatase